MKNTQLKAYLHNFFQEQTDAFLGAKAEAAAIRATTLKCSASQLTEQLRLWGVDFQPLPFNPDGFILADDKMPLSHTLDFFRGRFQYQGIASQIPALALAPRPGETVLEMAAAPGSKATQLAALMENRGQLYLNDWSRKRLQPLQANVQRAGVTNSVLLNMPGERLGNFLPDYFDKVLLDAPCSALGTLAGHPEVANWWTADILKKLPLLQDQLLISAFKALKAGGELVYSTCSIGPEENEMVIDRLLKNYPLEIIEIHLPGNVNFLPGLIQYGQQSFDPSLNKAQRTMPHLHGMEGFFIVKLRKLAQNRNTTASNQTIFQSTRTWKDPAVQTILQNISDNWGISADFWMDYRYILTSDRIWLCSCEIEEIPAADFNCAGLLLAERRGNRWKLFNQSVQFLGQRISRRRIQLSTAQLKTLFGAGRVAAEGISNGYHVLE